jgi:tRNA pseudouridine55 synthase
VKKIIILNKKEGETPLEALDNFRNKNPEYLGVPMTYAGRLDPMASGVLLILSGEKTKNKEKYLALEKEYNFKVLFGFSTDTYDILGKIISSDKLHLNKIELKNQIRKNIKSFIGESIQKYPMYSSKTVNGKPLFTYARCGEDVEIPERKVFIKKLELEKITNLSNKKLFRNIEKRIKKVKGDFRQNEVLKIWRENLENKHQMFAIASFNIKCSSGTYVRGIANTLGKNTGIPALAFSIKRTKVGKYAIIKKQ